MKQLIKRIVSIIIGLIIAIRITIAPIILFGVFFLTPLILIALAYSKIDKWLTGKSLTYTDGDKTALEMAFICTFGGAVYGVAYVVARWNK
jgi:hypothetical protein